VQNCFGNPSKADPPAAVATGEVLFKQNKNTQEGNNYSWKQARESEKQKLATAAAAAATAAGEKEEETDCSWRSKDKKRKMTRWVFSDYRLQRNKDALESRQPTTPKRQSS
jgi:hypothetical protein